MTSIRTWALAVAGIIGSGMLLFAAALPAYAYGYGGEYGSYGYGTSYGNNYGYQAPQQYGYGGYGYGGQPPYQYQNSYQSYQPYETYWGETPYNLNPIYSGPAPYYNDPYYSPFTFESGYYGSCNGQPCGGAFMPNSPYYGGFELAPPATAYPTGWYY